MRSARKSIRGYLKYLFSFEQVNGMPNINNALEGVFTNLKNSLRVHAGMSEANRKRFVNGFFLAYAKMHNKKEG